MSGRICRHQQEKLSVNKNITGGSFPSSSGASDRNQRVFQKGALLNKLRPLFFVLIVIFLSGCEFNNTVAIYKYDVGDIVYLKPDSTKGVISEIGGAQDDYTVIIGYDSGAFANNLEYVKEEMIYGK